MKQIYANNLTTLSLGRQGENLARQVVFDIRDLESLYGSGTVEVIHQRPGDAQPYPLAVQRDGTLVTWDVTATDTEMSAATANERYGKCELRYYAGETLAKSQIWRTWVESAMDTPSETAPPEPEQGWVEQVLATGVAAQQAADAAKADADRAATLAAEVSVKAVQTAQDATASAQAKEAAQTAQRLAEEAQSAAETAQRGAEDANTKAEASKEASAKSETAAKLSEQNAKASETAAKASETAAAESASAAQQSATSAAESAAVYDNVVADVTQLKQDVAAITPDDTAVDGKPWTSKKIVDSLCMPFEESGNPVQCYPVENYPLGVKVSWEPVQDGSGDPSPDNIRPITGRDAVSVTNHGKNYVTDRYHDISGEYNGISFIINDDKTIKMSGTATNNTVFLINSFSAGKRKKIYPGTYTLSGGLTNAELTFVAYDGNEPDSKGILNEKLKSSGETVTFTINDISYYGVYVYIYAGNAVNGVMKPQLELGSTATPYEPYTGSTTDIALPETVYGGTLDVETGLVTVEWIEKVTKLGDTSLLTPVGDGFVRKDFPSVANVMLGNSNQKCNIAPFDYNFNGAYTHFYHGTDDYAMIILPVDTPAETVIQTVVKVSVPYTIQLTPQQITALSGVNTIYTDADGVIVTGAEDPKHTITELKNAIISLGGNI